MDDAFPDFVEVERLLRSGSFEDARPVWYSSNYVFLAQMCAEDQHFAAIYKPRRGEAPLWDFPNGTLFCREVAAYQLSRLLGWDCIPPTVVADGPHGVGALQLYIRHDPESHFFTQRDEPAHADQLKRLAVFDYVANNADRKGGHCLLDASGHIWGIDHGLCFHEQYKLRSVIWDWAGEAIPEPWLMDIGRLRDTLDEGGPDTAPLLDLLAAEEIDALKERADQLVAGGRFPQPGPHRSYPWPLV